ncbi:uncharacterized protein L203_106027 [Cryptococcus depauperatus CBS 7841]|uniref:Uncharacterized protein n=1 Tax=Cryptococcus depauperatus CBS 7841 TaxID=1295531 RepID=A0A1E3IV33_9TREE|nr:hypothetical protein L203_00734 [Cryptococcus depauperatus CBS 7841]
MDLSYNVVAEYCTAQMVRYQECVLKNQSGDWNSICRPEGRALAACADAAVPHLAQLKASCAPAIEAYRQCLDKNGAEPDQIISERCGKLLKLLWECSEKTVAAIEKREVSEKKQI